jgi:hypothetical protein
MAVKQSNVKEPRKDLIMREDRRVGRKQEAGFALILAILSLMLLTFLGLSLAVTTSTELQIATNYRWSQQAYYNALAGAEIAKRFLQTIEWRVFLPDARGAGQMTTYPPAPLARVGPYGEPSRNFENWQCDQGQLGGGQGYGVVLDAPNFTVPFQNTSTMEGQTLNGTFTIWVRRRTEFDKVGGSDRVIDRSEPDRIVMTVEGTAPATGTTAAVLSTRAIRYIEVELQKTDPGECENYTGQQGSGPGGTGYDPCSFVQAGGVPVAGGGAARSIAAGRQ